MRARATIAALLLTLAPSACRSRDPRPQQAPQTLLATAEAEIPPPPPLVVLHQRDDRDVVRAGSFLSADRTVVLLTFRTPNRHREAGMAIVLDPHEPRPTFQTLPERSTPDGGPPALTFLDDPTGRTDGMVTDFVPALDPLTGVMVGRLHVLRDRAARTTSSDRSLSPPPNDLRWAGPGLTWVVEGELEIALRGPRGEQLWRPFDMDGPTLRPGPILRRPPPSPAPGPRVRLATRCEDAGCETSVTLATDQGTGSGSLQQRTPVE